MGASRLTAKSYTEEEIREIAARQGLVGYPHLALMREKLSVKAKNEPKFRFYNLKRLVVETETLKCAWAQVRANKGRNADGGLRFPALAFSVGRFPCHERGELSDRSALDGVRMRKCEHFGSGVRFTLKRHLKGWMEWMH